MVKNLQYHHRNVTPVKSCDFRKLGNFEEIPDMLKIDGMASTKPAFQKADLDIYGRKLQRISYRTLHRKNLFHLISWIYLQHFLQNCLRKYIFIPNSAKTPRSFHILCFLELYTTYWLLNYILRVTLLHQRPKVDIFRKTLFWDLGWNTNLVLYCVLMSAEQDLKRICKFLY